MAQIQAAQMTAQAVAVIPAVTMSQLPGVTAPTEQNQNSTMALGGMQTGHHDVTGSQTDKHSIPPEAVWSGMVTGIMIVLMDIAGMMTTTRAVMTGKTPGAVVTGSTQGVVMGKRMIDQSLLVTPGALLVRLVFLAATGLGISSIEQGPVTDRIITPCLQKVN